MNLEKFTDRAKGFLQAAQTVAIRLNHQRITPLHIAKALLEDSEGMENMGDIDLNSELPKGFIDETEIQFGALPAGAYWLHWIAIAQDGHTMNGNVRFAVEAE